MSRDKRLKTGGLSAHALREMEAGVGTLNRVVTDAGPDSGGSVAGAGGAARHCGGAVAGVIKAVMIGGLMKNHLLLGGLLFAVALFGGLTAGADPAARSEDGLTPPTPEGWSDFAPGGIWFHSYRFETDAGQGGENYGNLLKEELINSPTNNSNAATENGALNDVGPLFFSKEDYVVSYVTDDGIVNVMTNVTTTVDGEEYFAKSGIVARKVMPNGAGGYKIVTYGEGNALVQKFPIAGMVSRILARRFWKNNAEKVIIPRAKSRDYRKQ